MDFSFWPTSAQPWPDLLRGCRWAEARGWHGIWVPDHFMTDEAAGRVDTVPPVPWLEAWTALAALAALVPRVRIGAMVSGNGYRHPALVANMAGTLDEISGGRAVVGLGAGWQENEHRRYGIDFGTVTERAERLDEACAMIRGLLDDDHASFEGVHYRLDEAPCAPSGVGGRRIPLLVGGAGPRRTLRTVARHADEWNRWATPDEVGPARATLARRCEEVGRDPGEIRVTIAVMTRFCDSPRQRDEVRARLGNHGGLVGSSTEEIRDLAGAYAEAGVDELVVADFNLPRDRREDVLERLQVEVLDPLR